MPEISRFFGIVIRIHFDDHEPPHIHAIYGEFEAEIGIDGPRLGMITSSGPTVIIRTGPTPDRWCDL